MCKKYFEKIPEWLLLPLFGILFLAFWPIILIYVGTKSLFSSKSTDEDKIAGAKVAIITIFSIATLVLLSIYENSISEFFNGILSGPLLIFLLVGLIVMVLLQKLFPKWKYIQSNSSDESATELN
jgi:membrane-associated HD superfamily phosphohydrolase